MGNVARGDASIAIQNPVTSDNGTFICSVKNPPDVYHNIPQTTLIVTERGKPLPQQHVLTSGIRFCQVFRSLSITCGTGSLEFRFRIPAVAQPFFLS